MQARRIRRRLRVICTRILRASLQCFPWEQAISNRAKCLPRSRCQPPKHRLTHCNEQPATGVLSGGEESCGQALGRGVREISGASRLYKILNLYKILKKTLNVERSGSNLLRVPAYK